MQKCKRTSQRLRCLPLELRLELELVRREHRRGVPGWGATQAVQRKPKCESGSARFNARDCLLEDVVTRGLVLLCFTQPIPDAKRIETHRTELGPK